MGKFTVYYSQLQGMDANQQIQCYLLQAWQTTLSSPGKVTIKLITFLKLMVEEIILSKHLRKIFAKLAKRCMTTNLHVLGDQHLSLFEKSKFFQLPKGQS